MSRTTLINTDAYFGTKNKKSGVMSPLGNMTQATINLNPNIITARKTGSSKGILASAITSIDGELQLTLNAINAAMLTNLLLGTRKSAAAVTGQTVTFTSANAGDIIPLNGFGVVVTDSGALVAGTDFYITPSGDCKIIDDLPTSSYTIEYSSIAGEKIGVLTQSQGFEFSMVFLDEYNKTKYYFPKVKINGTDAMPLLAAEEFATYTVRATVLEGDYVDADPEFGRTCLIEKLTDEEWEARLDAGTLGQNV